MRCGSRGGGRGGATALLRNSWRLSSPQPNPPPAASQLAPPAAHAARGLSGVGSPRGGGGCWGGAVAPGTAEWNPWGGVENGGRRGSRDTPEAKPILYWVLSAGPGEPCSASPSPGTLPSHPEQDPEVKLLRVTAQRRRCAPPRPSGHCSLCRISQCSGDCRGGKLGRGKGALRGSLQSEAVSPGGCPLVTTSGNLERRGLNNCSRGTGARTSRYRHWVSPAAARLSRLGKPSGGPAAGPREREDPSLPRPCGVLPGLRP